MSILLKQLLTNIALESVEVNEIDNAIAEHEAATESVQALESLALALESTIQSGRGYTALEMALHDTAVAAHHKLIGLARPQAPAMESFATPESSLVASRLALESLSETTKKVGATLKEFVVAIVAKLREWLGRASSWVKSFFAKKDAKKDIEKAKEVFKEAEIKPSEDVEKVLADLKHSIYEIFGESPPVENKATLTALQKKFEALEEREKELGSTCFSPGGVEQMIVDLTRGIKYNDFKHAAESGRSEIVRVSTEMEKAYRSLREYEHTIFASTGAKLDPTGWEAMWKKVTDFKAEMDAIEHTVRDFTDKVLSSVSREDNPEHCIRLLVGAYHKYASARIYIIKQAGRTMEYLNVCSDIAALKLQIDQLSLVVGK